MENEIRNLILNTLNVTECKPSKTLSIGKCEYSNHSVQIDLYYLKETDFKNARNILKNVLKDKFVYPTIDSYFDTTNKFYRATFQFVVQEREG